MPPETPGGIFIIWIYRICSLKLYRGDPDGSHNRIVKSRREENEQSRGA